MPTINDLRTQAATIKNATQVGENTATRVGTTFETIADLLEGANVGQGIPSVDLAQLNSLRTPADQTTANPTIYNVTTLHNLSSTTIKVGTLFIFSDGGRAVVTQILLSNYQVDGGGNISSPNASQITMYYRMYNIVNETWSAWTLYGGGGGGGTIDPYPVSGSSNAVESNGVFEGLQKAAPEVDINDIDDLDDYVNMQTGEASTYTIKAYHNLSSTWLRVGVLMVFANQANNTLTQICISNCMVDGGGNLIPNYTTNVMNVFYRFKQFSGNPPEGMTIGVWTTWAKFGDSGYQPDNEDIDLNADDQLQFANKSYDASAFSGLGRVYLRKNIVTSGGVEKNVLTQAMMNTANTIYHIQYDYDLNGQTINLPAGCVLEFDGGSIRNGEIQGTDVSIIADGKIFYSITGSITNCKSVVRTCWFGFNTSDIQKAIDIFPNSTISIDSGEYIHDVKVVVPYDILLQSGNVRITTAIDAPVFELYIQGLPVKLDSISIFMDASYANSSVVLKGVGYSNIRGYNLNYYPTNTKDIKLPYVCKYPGATSAGLSVAYEIITGDDAQEYHYLYWNRIYGSARGVHTCLRINCNGDAGTITSNEYHITCWWCMNAVSVSENVGGPFYIYYQCSSHSEKIYKNDSYEAQRLEGKGPYINLYIMDQHYVSSENISQMIDNPAVMQVDGYNIYRSAKSLFRNSNKTRDRNEYRDSRLSDAELAYGNVLFSNSSIVEVRLRDVTDYEDALLNLTNYFNSCNPTRTINFDLNIGQRLTDASTSFTNNFKKLCCDGELSSPTNIKIDFVLPYYGSYHKSLIKYLYYKKTNLTTGVEILILYSVEYDEQENATSLVMLYKKVVGEVVAEPVLGEHGYVDKGVYYIDSLKANLMYSDTLKGFVDDNGSLIIQEPTTYDELLSAPFNIVQNKIFKINGGLYYVSQLGIYPQGSIVYNRYPTSGESWTFSFMDETFTITFPEEVFTSYSDLHVYIKSEAKKQGVNNFIFGESSSSNFRQYYSLMTHIQLPSKYASSYYGKVVDGDGNVVSQSPYFGEKGSQNTIVPVQQVLSGTFANKPAGTDIYVGFRYFCTDKQTTEGGSNGIEITYKGNDVWVDALGRVVS